MRCYPVAIWLENDSGDTLCISAIRVFDVKAFDLEIGDELFCYEIAPGEIMVVPQEFLLREEVMN